MLLKIPAHLLKLNPDLSENEIRTIIKMILNHKTSKLKSSHIVNFKMPLVGRFKTHGNKKVKRYKKELTKDRRKKRIKYRKQQTTKEKLLW